jgi:two-component system, NarL family, sensor histidine kinase YdfH
MARVAETAVWRRLAVQVDSVQMDNPQLTQSRYNHGMTKSGRPIFPNRIFQSDIFQSDGFADARPFYVIITFTLLITSALTLFETPDPMPLARLPLFSALLALHIALHWFSNFVAVQKGWPKRYLLAQAFLAVAVSLVSQQPEIVISLFVTLIAETLGLIGLTRLAATAVIGYTALAGATFYLIGGQAVLAQWSPTAFSTIFLFVIFMILYRRQMVARQHSQDLLRELAAAHRQLADYAAQVERLTLAAERQRMARELHDTLAQGVAGLVLQLEAANNHLENGRAARAQTIIAQSMKRARHTLADARAAIDDLRHEDRSLTEIIRRHAERFTEATGIPCHLTLRLEDELATAVPPVIADHAGRIISESLTNITRHAQARHVWLEVTQPPGQLTITVRDDGVGFVVATAVRANHYGLMGMRERARLVNGTLAITSEPGKGTELIATLPVEEQETED